MAGMLYLPRLFVYHCEAEAGSKQSETFKVMERRLLRGDRESSHDPGQRTRARPSVWPSSTIEEARKRPSKPINATANERTQRYDNHAS
jgi:hypothetical protein